MYDLAEFRHFKYLLAIAENGGFRAAAQKLRVSQPALSKQAKEFQEYLNVSLFKKTKSGRIRLTTVGSAFIPIARDVLQVRLEAINALKSIQEYVSPLLRIGCSSFVDPEICARACALYKEISPLSDIRPTLGFASQILDELVHGEIDVAIVTLPFDVQGFRTESISQDRLVACLPQDHPLASKVALSASDLEANLRVFRQPSQHPSAHARLAELLGDIGIEIKDHARTSHPQETMKLVERGFGFALLREGTSLGPGLTTRPIFGVDWTVDTAMIFKEDTGLNYLPIIARSLRREFSEGSSLVSMKKSVASVHGSKVGSKATKPG